MSMLVPCRKCSTCLDIRSSLLTKRCEDECHQHKYSIFFTLTYDNHHLPLMISQSVGFSGQMSFVSNRPFFDNGKTFGTLTSRVTPEDLTKLRPTRLCTDVFSFAIVCKYDVQLFLKRLRIDIFRNLFNSNKSDYNQNGTFRYFISSEYGPHTYRPHYHGLIWTDSEKVANYLVRPYKIVNGRKDFSDSPLYKAWKMCSSRGIDLGFVSGSATQYVASYSNGYINLPTILQNQCTRPFVICSKNPIIGSYAPCEKEICFCLANGTIKLDKFEPFVFSDDVLPLQAFNKVFGLPKRCYQLSFEDFLLLFEKYQSKRYIKSVCATDVCMPFFKYIHSTSFNPADYYFCRKVSNFVSKVHTYYYLDDDNFLHSYTAQYPYYVILQMIYSVIRSYARYRNELFYSRFLFTSTIDYQWLSEYHNTLIILPSILHDYDEFFDICGLNEDIFNYLYYYDTDRKLYIKDTSYIRWLLHFNHESYANSHALHIKHSLITKVFNDTHSNFIY